jgi:hypothetical protein
MKQILQSLKTDATEVADAPCPAVQRGQLLIRSTRTLVSAGATWGQTPFFPSA